MVYLSVACIHAQLLPLCLTLCDSMDCGPSGSSLHEIFQERIPEWVAMPSLQGIFLTQGLNPCLLCLLHCRQILYPLSHLGSSICLLFAAKHGEWQSMTGKVRASEIISLNSHHGQSRKQCSEVGRGWCRSQRKLLSRAEGHNFCLTGLNGNLRNPSLALLFVHIPSMRRSQWITRTFRKCTFSLHFPCTETSGTSAKKSEMSQVSCCHWHCKNKSL